MRAGLFLLLLIMMTTCVAQEPRWQEDFNEINETWSFEEGTRNSAQNRKDSFRIDDGVLILSVRKKDDEFFAGIIKTKVNFEMERGYLELEVQFGKLPTGCWVSLWLYNDKMEKESSKEHEDAFEVDIAEKRSYDWNNKDINRVVTHALHWAGYFDKRQYLSADSGDRDLSEGWHTYGIEINDTHIVWWIDGEKSWEVERFSEMKSMHLILSAELRDGFPDWVGKLPTEDFHIDVLFVDRIIYYNRKP